MYSVLGSLLGFFSKRGNAEKESTEWELRRMTAHGKLILRRILRRIPGIGQAYLQWRQIRAVAYHRLAGSPTPPPHIIKLRWLRRFQQSYSIGTLVETGTCKGTTVAAMLNQFEQIYTIELYYQLWERAHGRFLQYPHVHVVQGDSGEVLSSILASIFDRCLFWLDGHFSGSQTARGAKDTPIVKELAAIRSHHRKDHVILIDDARCFNGMNDYPTLDSVFSMLKEINPDYTIRVVDDIIQAYP